MLSRLCLRLSTNKTFSIMGESELPISPLPNIFPFELSPKVTNPLSSLVKFMNFEKSPVMCLEQPLSKNHKFLLVLFFGTYKTRIQTLIFGTHIFLGPCKLVLESLYTQLFFFPK